MKYNIEDLLIEVNRLSKIINDLQEENLYRMNAQYSVADELAESIKENRLLKSKLYWWQK